MANLPAPGRALPRFTRQQLAAAVMATTVGMQCSASLAQEESRKGGYRAQLEEVVVTAQKREENTMSVPITVNSFTAQDMVNTGALNVQDIDDFKKWTPIIGQRYKCIPLFHAAILVALS